MPDTPQPSQPPQPALPPVPYPGKKPRVILTSTLLALVLLTGSCILTSVWDGYYDLDRGLVGRWILTPVTVLCGLKFLYDVVLLCRKRIDAGELFAATLILFMGYYEFLFLLCPPLD